jgi:hypothetical protein
MQTFRKRFKILFIIVDTAFLPAFGFIIQQLDFRRTRPPVLALKYNPETSPA